MVVAFVIGGEVSIGAGADAVADDDDDDLSSPRWTRRDFLFFVDDEVVVGAGDDVGGLIGDVAVLERDRDRERAGLGGGRDAAADADVDGEGLDVAAASGADADDAGLFLHEGYPAIAQLVASSSAFCVAAAFDDAMNEVFLDLPGVDDDLGGAKVTTEAGRPSSSLCLFLSSSSSLSSLFLSNISFLLLFLSDFVLISIFPVAFLSAVFLFLFDNSSAVTLSTLSLPAAPSHLSSKCGFFPLLLSPS